MATEEVDPQKDIINMDFEGVEATDGDIVSMTKLLRQLVRESGVDPEMFAKLLVSQNYVGSVLKPCPDDFDYDEGEDPEDQPVYAITSIVNLSKKDPVAKSIVNFIRKCVRDETIEVKKAGNAFEEFIREDVAGGPSPVLTLGLLVKERFSNMPLSLLHPSLTSLQMDIDKAVQKGMPYKFTHFIYWSKMYASGGEEFYYDEEDIWFKENSIGYFSYILKEADTVQVKSEDDSAMATAGCPFRRIYVLEYAKLSSFIQHLTEITLPLI